MADRRPRPVSFDEFRGILADLLRIGEEKVTRSASLTADLFVTSLHWLELALQIEQLGVEIPSEAMWEIETAGDAYDAYLTYLAVKD
jgi:acyl carrier protein